MDYGICFCFQHQPLLHVKSEYFGDLGTNGQTMVQPGVKSLHKCELTWKQVLRLFCPPPGSF